MFIDVKSEIKSKEIIELLDYAVYQEPEALEKALSSYSLNDSLKLYALKEEETNEYIGLVGYEMDSERKLVIHHLSTPLHTEDRGMVD